MKYIFYCLFLSSSIISYSQNVERITFTDIGADGSQRITRKVNAVFCGWFQQEMKREGNLMAIYRTFKLFDNEWSDWELVERQPMRGTTISDWYYDFARLYTLFPNLGSIAPLGEGINVLRIVSTPIGQTKPFWWNTDGNSFFVFYKLYVVDN